MPAKYVDNIQHQMLSNQPVSAPTPMLIGTHLQIPARANLMPTVNLECARLALSVLQLSQMDVNAQQTTPFGYLQITRACVHQQHTIIQEYVQHADPIHLQQQTKRPAHVLPQILYGIVQIILAVATHCHSYLVMFVCFALLVQHQMSETLSACAQM